MTSKNLIRWISRLCEPLIHILEKPNEKDAALTHIVQKT